MKKIRTFNCSHKIRNRNMKRISKNQKNKHNVRMNSIDIVDFKQKIKKSKKSELLDFFKEKFTNNESIEIKDKKITIVIPEIFSLITNPNDAFKIINKLTYIYKNRMDLDFNTIFFDYSKNKHLELSALSLQNITCLILINNGINFEGNINKKWSKETISLYFYNGLYDAFKLDPKEFLENIKIPHKLNLLGGGKDKPEITCDKMKLGGVTETKVTDWFNSCLLKNGFELNKKGRKNLFFILAEIFSNCSEHSGDEINQYYCSAHYHHMENDIGKVRISIFNFGQTIADGLSDNDTLPFKTKKRIDDLIKKHTNLFNFRNWDSESLLTLYSLQNQVSRVYEKDTSRGTGTVKFIECFTNLGKSLNKDFIPNLSIISGRTQILITDSEICETTKDRNIPLNKEKDLGKPPSKDYVKKIDYNFPGTMISLDIYLDKNFMEKEQGGKV